MTRAVVLFGHGSRDPEWRRPMDAVAQRLAQRAPEVRVACAFLELQPPTLQEAVATLLAQGVREITVLPMFLGVGKHAREDLPQLAASLRGRHPELRLALRPAVGEHPALLDLLATLALE